jgi:hypothetical protein
MQTEPAVPFYLSKTLIVNAIIAIAAFFPSVRSWVQENPGITLTAVTALGTALRIVTKGRLVLN